MAQREAKDDAAGFGVDVGGAVALEIVDDDQPLRAGWDGSSHLVEHRIGVHTAGGGEGGFLAQKLSRSHLTIEPVETWPPSTVYWPGTTASV